MTTTPRNQTIIYFGTKITIHDHLAATRHYGSKAKILQAIEKFYVDLRMGRVPATSLKS